MYVGGWDGAKSTKKGSTMGVYVWVGGMGLKAQKGSSYYGHREKSVWVCVGWS